MYCTSTKTDINFQQTKTIVTRVWQIKHNTLTWTMYKKKNIHTVLHTSTLKQLKNNLLSTAKSSKIRTK